MRSVKNWALASGLCLAAALAPFQVSVQAQVSVSRGPLATSDGGELSLNLGDGETLTIQISDGNIIVNGDEVGSFDAVRLEDSWREVLTEIGRLDFGPSGEQSWREVAPDISSTVSLALGNAIEAVEVAHETETGAKALQMRQLEAALEQVAATQEQEEALQGHLAEMLERLEQEDNVQLNLDNARIVFGAVEIAEDDVIDGSMVVLGGEVELRGIVTGDLLAFGGDVRLYRGSRVGGDVVSVDGNVIGSTSLVEGVVRSLDSDLDLPEPRKLVRFDIEPNVSAPLAVGSGIVTLLGTLVAFASIGFGLTFFAPNQLELVAGRVAEHPGKSFFAGLFAQPLILPALAMLTVGLAVSVVGVILIPFAIIAAVLGVVAAAVVGYLAVARSLGARHARQRAARLGKEANPNPFEALVRGLVILMAVWLPAVLLSWVPLAGVPVAVVALMFTWVMATAGFGAVLTTGAGLRGQLNWRKRATLETGEVKARRR